MPSTPTDPKQSSALSKVAEHPVDLSIYVKELNIVEFITNAKEAGFDTKTLESDSKNKTELSFKQLGVIQAKAIGEKIIVLEDYLTKLVTGEELKKEREKLFRTCKLLMIALDKGIFPEEVFPKKPKIDIQKNKIITLKKIKSLLEKILKKLQLITKPAKLNPADYERRPPVIGGTKASFHASLFGFYFEDFFNNLIRIKELITYSQALEQKLVQKNDIANVLNALIKLPFRNNIDKEFEKLSALVNFVTKQMHRIPPEKFFDSTNQEINEVAKNELLHMLKIFIAELLKSQLRNLVVMPDDFAVYGYEFFNSVLQADWLSHKDNLGSFIRVSIDKKREDYEDFLKKHKEESKKIESSAVLISTVVNQHSQSKQDLFALGKSNIELFDSQKVATITPSFNPASTAIDKQPSHEVPFPPSILMIPSIKLHGAPLKCKKPTARTTDTTIRKQNEPKGLINTSANNMDGIKKDTRLAKLNRIFSARLEAFKPNQDRCKKAFDENKYSSDVIKTLLSYQNSNFGVLCQIDAKYLEVKAGTLLKFHQEFIESQTMSVLQDFKTDLTNVKDWFLFIVKSCDFINWVRESIDQTTMKRFKNTLSENTWNGLTNIRHAATHLPDSLDAIEAIVLEHDTQPKIIDPSDRHFFLNAIDFLINNEKKSQGSAGSFAKQEPVMHDDSINDVPDQSIYSSLVSAEILLYILAKVNKFPAKEETEKLQRLDGLMRAIGQSLACITSIEVKSLLDNMEKKASAVQGTASMTASFSLDDKKDFRSFMMDIHIIRDYRNKRTHSGCPLDRQSCLTQFNLLTSDKFLNQLKKCQDMFKAHDSSLVVVQVNASPVKKTEIPPSTMAPGLYKSLMKLFNAKAHGDKKIDLVQKVKTLTHCNVG